MIPLKFSPEKGGKAACLEEAGGSNLKDQPRFLLTCFLRIEACEITKRCCVDRHCVFRWPPPSALMGRTGMTTSLFPRTGIYSLRTEPARPRLTALLPSDGAGGWCGWSRRARQGLSRTRWWWASLRAPPAQTRAPPTARTQTLPLWPQPTCEGTPSVHFSFLPSRCHDPKRNSAGGGGGCSFGGAAAVS